MSNTTNAMLTLINMSALRSHEALIDKCVNVDTHFIDDEWLNEWNWSEGEKVLLNVLRVIARGHGMCRLDELYKLDKENQEVVLTAMRIRLGLDNLGSVFV